LHPLGDLLTSRDMCVIGALGFVWMYHIKNISYCQEVFLKNKKIYFLTFQTIFFKMRTMEINIAKLERERERIGLSKMEICRSLGIHYQNWDYIIKTRKTKLSTIQKIADFFLIDPKDLLK